MATFVSGGTGYIGRKLVRALIREGESVHVLVRKESDRTDLNHPMIRLFEGDILDGDSVRRAVCGCTRAFHLAAYARVWARSPEVYHNYNVGGLRSVLDACFRYGVRKVVFTSTAVTMTPSDGTHADESSAHREEFFTDYERSKYLAEMEASRFAENGLEVVIVNPTRVYGPGKMTEANAVTRMIGLYAKGKFPFLLSRGEHLGNYVFVDDVVRGHFLAMEKGKSGERYVVGGENATLWEFFQLVREVTGIRRMQIPIPPWMARTIGSLEEAKARLLGIQPMVTRGWVETFLQHWPFSSRKAVEELGYGVTPLRLGLERTWNWLSNGPGRAVLQGL